MESLIIFIIFIVFSVLRSLGGQGQRPPGQGPGVPPVRPARPVRPVRPVPPLTRPERLPPEYADWVLEAETQDAEAKRSFQPVTPLEPAPQRAESRAKAQPDGEERAVPEKKQRFQPGADSLLQGIVFAEVLGPPRIKKPWRPK